jgi:hypothetical protein
VKHEREYIMLFGSHLLTSRSINWFGAQSGRIPLHRRSLAISNPRAERPFAAYEEFGVEDP